LTRSPVGIDCLFEIVQQLGRSLNLVENDRTWMVGEKSDRISESARTRVGTLQRNVAVTLAEEVP
jgi:hypothetical protein